MREGSAEHPEGSQVDPRHWWTALQAAVDRAGGLDDVAAVSVAGQQHGLVCLDEDGDIVRTASLWNDLAPAAAAAALAAELGPQQWADAVGLVPRASFTAAKLRWLAEADPVSAGRTAAVCLPHDYVMWRLANNGELARLTPDRGDASGTGYWSPRTGSYRAGTRLYPLVSELATDGIPVAVACLFGDRSPALLPVALEPGDQHRILAGPRGQRGVRRSP